jgi:hypothetical protein
MIAMSRLSIPICTANMYAHSSSVTHLWRSKPNDP